MLNEHELKAYLLLEVRKKTINWNGIELTYEIGKGRIKNCLYYPDKYHFREDEIEKLNQFIKDLQISSNLQ